MTNEEKISIKRLAEKVDEMAREMATKDLLRAEVGRLDEALEDHVEYTRAASEAESKRLDSIREVDAAAVRVANERAVEQTGILAKQVESVATTLRELVSTTATATAENQNKLFDPIITRVNRLEENQFINQGKEKYTDPMLIDLVKQMKDVAISLSENKGRSGISTLWIISIAASVGGIVVYIVTSLIK